MGGVNDLKQVWPHFINRPLKDVTMKYERTPDVGDEQVYTFVLQDGTVVEVKPDWKSGPKPYTPDDIVKFAASKLKEIEVNRASMQGLLSPGLGVENDAAKPDLKEGPVEGFFSSNKETEQ